MGEGSESSRSGGFCGWFIVLLVLGVIAAAIVVTVKVKKNHHSAPELGPVPGPPGPVVQKYGHALTLAMQFFEVQQCNVLGLHSLFCCIHSVDFFLFHSISVHHNYHQINLLKIGRF